MTRNKKREGEERGEELNTKAQRYNGTRVRQGQGKAKFLIFSMSSSDLKLTHLSFYNPIIMGLIACFHLQRYELQK